MRLSGRKNAVPFRLKRVREELSRAFAEGRNGDLILREFETGGGRAALLAYLSGMASETRIDEFVLRPLMGSEERTLEGIMKGALEIAEVRRERDIEKAVSGVLGGLAALFLEGEGECLLLETHGETKRQVGVTENEKVVRGPKEGFTEDMRTNITLVRRFVKRPDLIAEIRPAGGSNGTELALLYLEDRAEAALVSNVKERLEGISADTVLDSGVIEQLIDRGGLLPLPGVLATERPDRAASHLMSGRICIIADGSPEALVVPATLASLMNSPEDVYLRPPLGTALRLVRCIGALVSVLLPAYFLALALYHQGLLSTEVLSTVIASRRMVFEPIGAEMILLLLIFQLIREAGLRVPGGIGQAIGIIGGLIMGQAAVTAHLASSVVLIIVAAAGLGNFCIPDYSLQVAAAYFRLAAVIAAWMGGLLGLAAASLLAVFLASEKESFGLPFLSPLAPFERRGRGVLLRGRIGDGA